MVLTKEKHCAAKHFLQPKAGFWCKIEQNSSRVSGTCLFYVFGAQCDQNVSNLNYFWPKLSSDNL